MANSFTYVPYKETGYFSTLVTDYVSGNERARPFYQFEPTEAGIDAAIAERAKHHTDRVTLVNALNDQYSQLEKSELTAANIKRLADENTFTICTAHQPNLMTGYLYFVYKILHAIKLADLLNGRYPGKHFVPVYYMGSEDNDLDELGVFRFRGEKFRWDGNGQQGAVGRMLTASLKPLIQQVLALFGPPGKDCTELETMVTTAYLKHKTIAEATQYLVNALFGRFGLIVINPDDARLKATFSDVMKDELLHQAAHPIITRQIEQLSDHYKIQAHPREINLFYLSAGLRERIIKTGAQWTVNETQIQWDEAALLEELHAHPERFSPNVMLRGLFQETILPNVAFIGGGAELAYWLQLKPLFEHYKVCYPALLLRQSVLWVPARAAELRKLTGYSIAEVFRPQTELEKQYVTTHAGADLQLNGEAADIERLMLAIKQKATGIDTTLGPAAEAALTRMRYQLTIIAQKMLRAEKRKMSVDLDRIARLKQWLFPGGGLQERVENFLDYYLEYGPAFFDTVLEGIDPLGQQFLIVE